MNGAKISRKVHKWISLFIGVQLLLWAISGFYMVVVDIDVIHGDMLVKNVARPVNIRDNKVVSVNSILRLYPEASALSIADILGEPVYQIRTPKGTRLLDGYRGKLISPLTKVTASAVAQYHYAGNGTVASVELIETNPPGEIRFMPLPVWRVDFDDLWGTSFYVQPDSGRLASRRHNLWRAFDFLWMLHIMDYEDRENVNNILLRSVSLFALILGISGTWLLLYSFRRTIKTGDTS